MHIFSGVYICSGNTATKLICYTRSTSEIHQLPAQYPPPTPLLLGDTKNSLVKSLIYEKVQFVIFLFIGNLVIFFLGRGCNVMQFFKHIITYYF